VILNKTAIIILNYNGLPYVLDCLKSLEYLKDNKRIRTIIVDNASRDRSVKLIKEKYPWVKVIENKKNLGFAGGNNKGIKWAIDNGFKNIMLLNPDTIVEKGFLNPLLRKVNKDKVGIVSPVLKGKEGNEAIYALGAKYNKILGRTKHVHLKQGQFKKLKHPIEQQLVSGCAVFVKSEVFEKIGLLDKRFFLYFEDSDFCIRAKRAGFKIFVCPKSVVVHKTSQSLGGLSLKKVFYVAGSNLKFILKNVNPLFWPLALIYLMLITIKMVFSVFWSKGVWPERLVLGAQSKFVAMHHLARYKYAKKFVKKDDLVLDAACGSGYGSAMLAEKAKKVYGIDICKKAILVSKIRYGRENINFMRMDCLGLDFKNNFFDKVVSFETLEHLKDPEKFLAEVKKVLKKGGVFLVSTPSCNKGKDIKPDNPWHYVEYNEKEFKKLLKKYFNKIQIYSQVYSNKIKKYCKKHEDVQNIKKKIVKKDRMVLRKVLPKPLKDFLWNMYTKIKLKKEAEKIKIEDFPVRKGYKKGAQILIGVCKK